MTGYGCGEAQRAGWRVRVELRSLNHRFLDISLRLPRHCLALEERIREVIGRHLSRGRVEVFLMAEPAEDAPRQVRVDTALARAYDQALRELAGALGWHGSPELVWLIQLPGVLQVSDWNTDVEALWSATAPAVDAALAALQEMRAQEGASLAADLRQRVANLERLSESIQQRAPEVEAAYRERLAARMAEFASVLEPGRLAAEAALHAEKISVHEELVRLRSHLQEMRRLLAADGPVGRRLDFLLQEAFREATTMAAKAQDARVSALVVEVKAELEKMREQGQNVE